MLSLLPFHAMVDTYIYIYIYYVSSSVHYTSLINLYAIYIYYMYVRINRTDHDLDEDYFVARMEDFEVDLSHSVSYVNSIHQLTVTSSEVMTGVLVDSNGEVINLITLITLINLMAISIFIIL